MSLYSNHVKIDGVTCGTICRGGPNGEYKAVFEREFASLEQIESINWARPRLSGPCELPEGYGFDVTGIEYHVDSRTFTVTLQVQNQYLGDVTGYQAQIDALGQDKTQLEQDKAQLEQNKAMLEQDKASLEQDNAQLGQDKAKLEQDKAQLEQDKASLEQNKAQLEQDNAAKEEAIRQLGDQLAEADETAIALYEELAAALDGTSEDEDQAAQSEASWTEGVEE